MAQKGYTSRSGRYTARPTLLGEAVPSNEGFSVAAWPLEAEIPVSYDAIDPPLPREEDEEGNITPTAALDDQYDEDEPDEEGSDEP
jgi:hypothetical protein